MKKSVIVFSLLISACAFGDFHDWAATPPMGWNSWDFYGTAATEAEMKMQADAQAKELRDFGWTLCTLDITWYDDHVGRTHGYNKDAVLEMDGFGRLMPGPNRFPSCANGAGLKPLGDYVHSKGLTFGIHIMRGIARQAVKANLPIKGAGGRTARDIANVEDTCCWNPHTYGVDMTKPGAQEYYDSLLELYAGWGVDFIKCDDISRPYTPAQRLEIEALRKAIDKCGRPIVLSLSPGDTPVSASGHVENFANMWRISDDFWDDWKPLYGMFGRLHRWEKSRVAGAWPDADMLPFGNLQFGRKCRFTEDEQRTCMSLWCIARSPLILGGDMTTLDAWTKSLLQNPEVIKVNQKGRNPHQLCRDKDNRIVWVSDAPEGGKYVALFNAATAGDGVPETAEVSVDLAALGFMGQAKVRDLWAHKDLGTFDSTFSATLKAHASGLYLITDAGFAGYLLTYFNDETHSLFFAVSDDGYVFTPVNEGKPVFDGTLLGDQKGIRDPYVMRGPDGAFYMALTDLHIYAKQKGFRETEWERPGEKFSWGNNRAIVMMKSTDLVNWTKSVFYVDKAYPETWSDVGCIWAPAIVWDNERGCPVVYVSMRHGGGPEQVYWAYADVEFTKLTSAPKKLMSIPSDDGKGEGSYIDGDVIYWKGKYHLTYTPHTEGGPGVKHAESDKATEGFAFDPKWVDQEPRACEGPTMWRRIGTDVWVLMYDRYGEYPHNFGFMETTDFVNWKFIGRFNEPGSPMKLVGASQPKHGAVIHLTPAEVARVKAMKEARLIAQPSRDADGEIALAEAGVAAD